MKKKYIIVVAVIISITAIILGIYTVLSMYIFDENWKVTNGHDELIEGFKSIENTEVRRESIDQAVKYNLITQEEANGLY